MAIHDSAFKSLEYIDKAMNPPWLRKLRQLEDMVRPPWLRQTEKLERLTYPRALADMNRLNEKIGAAVTIASKMNAIGCKFDDLQRLNDKVGVAVSLASKMNAISSKFDLSQQTLKVMQAAHLAVGRHAPLGEAFDSVRKMQEIVQPLGLADRLQPFERFEELYKPALPASAADALGHHLRDTALPSLAFLSMPWERPVGLLAGMETPLRGASFVWPDEESDERAVALGLLLEPQSEKPNIVIETRVVCFLCRQELITRDETFQWIGDDRGFLDIPAAAVCSSCLSEDPTTYLERIVEALRAGEPTLHFEVIDGGGEGSGKPERRDHLRLVSSDADDIDDEPIE